MVSRVTIIAIAVSEKVCRYTLAHMALNTIIQEIQ